MVCLNSPKYFFMRFGMKDALLGNNKALRQAIALAMNAENLIELMYNGRGYIAESMIPLEISGSSHDTQSIWYRQNLDRKAGDQRFSQTACDPHADRAGWIAVATTGKSFFEPRIEGDQRNRRER